MATIEKIEAAAKRLHGNARVTPLLSSPFLDEIAGRRVLVKAECLQHTGSFKFRGGWAAVSSLGFHARKRGVIAYSSGNHAQGVAAAAKAHNTPAVIVMPADAPQLKIDNTRALGAEVVLYDRVGGEDREAIGAKLAEERRLTLIEPYEHPEVVAGQGSVGLEIAKQTAALGITDAEIAICCGGGGLASGVALALEKYAPNMRVRPAEPVGFDDVARSLAAGKIVSNSAATGSICDAILTPEPGATTFPILKRLAGAGVAVTDTDAMRAVAQAFLRLKLVVEPGGAVSLAAALFHPDAFESDTVIAVATGGNIDPATFQTALSEFTG